VAEKVNENAKYKAISGSLSDYFGFKLSDNSSVLSGETVCCMTRDKCFAYHGFEHVITISYILYGRCIK